MNIKPKFRLPVSSRDIVQRWGRWIRSERAWLVWWPVVVALIAFAGFLLFEVTSRLEHRTEMERAKAGWAELMAEEVRQLQLAASASHAVDPLVVRQAIETSMQKLQIPAADLTVGPAKDGFVEVNSNGVKFDVWIRWVELLFNEGRIALHSARLMQSSPGMVRIEAKFSY